MTPDYERISPNVASYARLGGDAWALPTDKSVWALYLGLVNNKTGFGPGIHSNIMEKR